MSSSEYPSQTDRSSKIMDTDFSGTIDAHEMRNALTEAGFTLNNKIQHSIALRYAGSKMTIDFDGFVACMIRLETLFNSAFDKTNTGTQMQKTFYPPQGLIGSAKGIDLQTSPSV
uniref:EF-hand domain-containing protein n=1 Tax=Podarcis muralis TaxID=64176 RepID=A0A670HY23_PODMU